MKEGTRLYQICAKGRYALFEGETIYYSKKVYLNEPTTENIDEFIEKCCNSNVPNNLYDLDRKTVQIYILELEISK